MSKGLVDLICFSHLRWGFVYQRPQHLLSRFAREYRVYFVEEPVWTESNPALRIQTDHESQVYVVQPLIQPGLDADQVAFIETKLLRELFGMCRIREYLLWYYTPMAVPFTRTLNPILTVYDCMDELAAFKGAPPVITELERELFQAADLVFTGGQTLYEAKKKQHPDVHAFPSSVDVTHFAQARKAQPEPQDQAPIPHPRIGYCGVIDERMDLNLIAEIAAAHPDWHLVMIGPVVKIDPGTLPRRTNIHYLGGKDYKALPSYMAGWDVAMLPFAHNESTRFISPTKTPEYLSAGKPTVSTSIRDVVRPYGELQLVEIADSATDFVQAIERGLTKEREPWMRKVDEFLAQMSWDETWRRMMNIIDDRLSAKRQSAQAAVNASQSSLIMKGNPNV